MTAYWIILIALTIAITANIFAIFSGRRAGRELDKLAASLEERWAEDKKGR